MHPNNVHKSESGWKSFQTRTNSGKNKRPGMMTRRDFVTVTMRQNRANNRSNNV